MLRLPLFRLACALALTLACAPAPATELPAQRNVLDMHGAPKDAADRSFNIFFDAGAWQGYSLPPQGDARSGFSGPFVHSLHGGRWTGRRFAQLELREGGQPLALHAVASDAVPGALVRRFEASGLAVTQTLFFADSWRAVVKVELLASAPRRLDVAVLGELLPAPEAKLAVAGASVQRDFGGTHTQLLTTLSAPAQAASVGEDYRLALRQPLSLAAGKTASFYVTQTLRYDSRQPLPPASDPAAAWAANRTRWAGYLRYADAAHLAGVPDATARHVALKAVQTLLGNWRAARGDLKHDGVIPSYSYPDFNGFWAWDSWKHAVALAAFAPQLAKDQIRAMFDYQRPDGMVIDALFLDRKDNNARDSKPPLASWAVLAVYRATGDKAFLAELYPKLVAYHRWWYAQRDHDHDGLAEYGATDGTRIAAAWESGMDNAVRFDGAKMLKNGDGAWSLDQASVDLNSYLYREKVELAEIASALGKPAEAKRWQAEAATLAQRVRTAFYDAKAGWFFDRRIPGGEPVRVFGSDGWAPLWAGVASAQEARAVIRTMLRPDMFATHMPFPTLAANDPHFAPLKGYWRGPVWLDQAYFGVAALRRYGEPAQADAMAARLVQNAQGLAAQTPIYENYDPLTGQPWQASNFSWSAASYLLLLHADTARAASGEPR